MNKKYIIISLSIVLLTGLLTILINKNSKEYIMQDGIMLALTLDGEKITSYPEGTNYGVEIACENGTGKWLVDEWKLAIEEVIGNVVCNIEFTSNPTSLKSKVEEVNTAWGGSYRYKDTNPNNYIWFNNEMWRIIGSVSTCLESYCSTKEHLVKIIRRDSIGALTYDAKSSDYKGAWGENTLYTLLNNYYYGAQDASETAYCYGYSTTTIAKCDYRKIGITSNSYYGKMIKNVYWNTGASSSGVAPNASEGFENNLAQTISGYVGLMTMSDYGYATTSNYYENYMTDFYLTDITKKNWLYGQGHELTSTKQQGDTGSIVIINHRGNTQSTTAIFGAHVRPVVYLDSSVYIVSGDGTEANPYQIGM